MVRTSDTQRDDKYDSNTFNNVQAELDDHCHAVVGSPSEFWKSEKN